METLPIRALLLTMAGLTAQAQVVIQPWDFHTEPGQWFRSWQNSQPVSCEGLLGEPGGPQVWNLACGPQQVELLTTAITGQQSGYAGDFPLAPLVEHQQDLASGAESWLFMDPASEGGRRVYGFVDEAFSTEDPVVTFDPPLLDFPLPLSYNTEWTAGTTFYTLVGGLSARIDYSAQFETDAWGTVILPQLGAASCLRVMELTSFAVSVDFTGNGTYLPYSTQYLRSYHFLARDRGIAASIVSPQQASVPPLQFTTASVFLRMFDSNHPADPLPPEPVTDLHLDLDSQGALLDWSPVPTATAYRVEWSDSSRPGTWHTLETVAAPPARDPDARPLARRCYRVIGIAGAAPRP